MNAGASTTGGGRWPGIAKADWRQGAQLASAVVLSWLASAALHLPEGFWAVMSALMVVRPTAGSTLGAGWERIRGILLGTVTGLAGAWLEGQGAGSPTAVLGMVALVAFASALAPGLRSAPISALIVLTSASGSGHAAVDVALMRVLEIAIGVTAGLAVTLVGTAAQARHRLPAACGAVLRQVALRCRGELAGTAPGTPAERETAAEQLRAWLRELTILAMAADREERLIARWRRARGAQAPAHPGPADGRHRRRVRLLTRIVQDTGALARVAEAFRDRAPGPAWTALGERVGAALDMAAAGIEAGGPASFDSLRSYLRGADGDAPDLPLRPFALATVHLLTQDLARLLAQAPLSASH